MSAAKKERKQPLNMSPVMFSGTWYNEAISVYLGCDDCTDVRKSVFFQCGWKKTRQTGTALSWCLVYSRDTSLNCGISTPHMVILFVSFVAVLCDGRFIRLN